MHYVVSGERYEEVFEGYRELLRAIVHETKYDTVLAKSMLPHIKEARRIIDKEVLLEGDKDEKR